MHLTAEVPVQGDTQRTMAAAEPVPDFELSGALEMQ